MTTKILMLAIVVFALFEIGRIIWSIAESTKMAKAMRPFSQKVISPRKKILYFGDSTGLGVGTTDSKYSVPGRIGADHPDVDIENNSANGRKSAQLVKTLEKDTSDKADLLIIAIGGADILYFVPIKKVIKSFGKAIDLAKEKAEKVLLIRPNNAGLSPMFQNSFLDMIYSYRSKKLHLELEKLVKEKGVQSIVLFHDKSEDPLAKDRKRFYGRDNSHPSNDGYAVWYEIMREKISQLLN